MHSGEGRKECQLPKDFQGTDFKGSVREGAAGAQSACARFSDWLASR